MPAKKNTNEAARKFNLDDKWRFSKFSKKNATVFSLIFGLIGVIIIIISLAQGRGDATISGVFNGKKITLSTCSSTSGAVCSLKWNGKEFVNNWDLGRQIETATHYDNAPSPCLNAGEPGSINGAKSNLLSIEKPSENELKTSIQLVYWLAPGQQNPAPGGCTAQNTTLMSTTVVNKTVTIGYRGISNAIDYDAVVKVPEKHSELNEASPAAYVGAEFDHYWKYEPDNKSLTAVSSGYSNTSNPNDPVRGVIVSTDNNQYALGLFMPKFTKGDPGSGHNYLAINHADLPGAGNSTTFPSCNFFRSSKYSDVLPPGNFHHHCVIVVGALSDVTGAMNKLRALDTANIKPPSIKAAYVVSGALQRAWKDALGMPNIYKNLTTTKIAVDKSVHDLKDMGFNAVVLQSAFYSVPGVKYSDWVKVFADAGHKYGIMVIPSLRPVGEGSPPNTNQFQVWEKSCESSTDTQKFINQFASNSDVAGFNCAFELWNKVKDNPKKGEITASIEKINELKKSIETMGKFYLTVPASGVSEPKLNGSPVFSIVTPQLSPSRNGTQPAMNATFAANSNSTIRGLEMPLYHGQLTAQYGFPAGDVGMRKWFSLMRTSYLQYRPQQFTLFNDQELIATKDTQYGYLFSQPRGVVMNILAKLDDPSLLLYDPLESEFATETLGGTVNGIYTSGVYRVIAPVDGRSLSLGNNQSLSYSTAKNINIHKGAIAFWIKPNWNGNDDQRHMIMFTQCNPSISTDAKNCIRLIKNQNNRLVLRFVDNHSTLDKTYAYTDISNWKAGQWHHVAFSWDETKGLDMFLDGHLVNHRDITWRINQLDPTLIVGSYNRRALWADATFDDLRIYNLTKSEIQIRQIMAAIGSIPASAKQSPIVTPKNSNESGDSGL